MIQLGNDYDNASSYTGNSGFSPLPIGGHICRIIGARAGQYSTGADMIEVAFDIAEGGPDDGRFQERFDYLRKSNPQAKWPNGGMFRTGILTREGKTSGFFKGLITAVEESNPGYSFKGSGCNEGTLKGKLVGFNFGEEEYMGNDGTLRTAVKAVYAVSVATVKEGIEPPKKKPYKPRPGEQMAAQGFTEVSDETLPF
jgi:hypothetical protein